VNIVTISHMHYVNRNSNIKWMQQVFVFQQIVAFYRREELAAEGKLVTKGASKKSNAKGKGKAKGDKPVQQITSQGTEEEPVIGELCFVFSL
jgi:hypothetical protein